MIEPKKEEEDVKTAQELSEDLEGRDLKTAESYCDVVTAREPKTSEAGSPVLHTSVERDFLDNQKND